MATSEESLAEYAKLLGITRDAGLILWTASTEQEFYDACEGLLAGAVGDVESARNEWRVLDEVGLSKLVVRLVTRASVRCDPEADHNGHVDITMRHVRDTQWVYLGECKIYDGYVYHCGGCEQLLERYSSGRQGRVFCLEFYKDDAMYEKQGALRAAFEKEKPLNFLSGARDHRQKGAFITVHKHRTTSEVEVLHLCCDLFVPVSPVAHGSHGTE